MNVNRTELIQALEAVKVGLSTGGSSEISHTFIFMDGFVFTYNDEISVRFPFSIGVEGAVDGKLFLSFLHKLKGDIISIDKNETGSEITVKQKRSKSGFTVQQDVDTPLSNITYTKKWISLEDTDFTKALQFTKHIPTADMSTPALTCIYLSGGKIQASDRYRVVEYVFDAENKTKIKNTLIPQQALGAVIAMNPTGIQISGNWVHFKNKKGSVLSCRTYDADFPNVSSFIGLTGDSITLPAGLLDILEKTALFGEVDNIITITIQKKILLIESKDVNGWYKEKIKINYQGPEITFSIMNYLLIGIIKEVDSFIINGALLSFSKNNWTYTTTTVV